MAKQKKTKKVNRKKELRNNIISKLEAALADFKAGMTEKKFKDALKKGGKLLSGLLNVKKKKVKVKIKVRKAKKKEPLPVTENTGQ